MRRYRKAFSGTKTQTTPWEKRRNKSFFLSLNSFSEAFGLLPHLP